MDFLHLCVFQAIFGQSSSLVGFNMFKSEGNQNLLFKDSTKCLQEVPSGKNYKEFLGREYITTIDSLRECAGSQTGKIPQNLYLNVDMDNKGDPKDLCSLFFSLSQNWRRPVPSIPAKIKSKCSSLSQAFSPACRNCRLCSHLLIIHLLLM